MTTLTIPVPDALTLWTAFDFCRKLNALQKADEIVFDFRRTRTVEPFGMLVIASEIKKCMVDHPEASLVCKNFEKMTYAGYMGFFQAFGHNFGLMPGQAAGSRNYVPITYFETEEIERNAAISGRDIGEEIEDKSKQMARTLLGKDDGDVFDMLSYSIREIMRNVVEHAQSDRFGVCAQYWPTKARAEVAIVDRGIGLRQSLSRNPHINADTDKNAINYALMPAVSGKAFKGARRGFDRGPWNNSGFGLYMTSRISRNGGNFFISSGEAGMLLTSGKQSKRYIPTNLTGTAVRLCIHTNLVESLQSSLAKYREDGYKIQEKYREIVSIDPSAASLMLSDDFDISIWEKLKLRLLGRS